MFTLHRQANRPELRRVTRSPSLEKDFPSSL
jgi:hypothetical protein